VVVVVVVCMSVRVCDVSVCVHVYGCYLMVGVFVQDLTAL
jgi:hypothetical protein